MYDKNNSSQYTFRLSGETQIGSGFVHLHTVHNVLKDIKWKMIEIQKYICHCSFFEKVFDCKF